MRAYFLFVCNERIEIDSNDSNNQRKKDQAEILSRNKWDVDSGVPLLSLFFLSFLTSLAFSLLVLLKRISSPVDDSVELDSSLPVFSTASCLEKACYKTFPRGEDREGVKDDESEKARAKIRGNSGEVMGGLLERSTSG